VAHLAGAALAARQALDVIGVIIASGGALRGLDRIEAAW
jgi:hypothetical protein